LTDVKKDILNEPGKVSNPFFCHSGLDPESSCFSMFWIPPACAGLRYRSETRRMPGGNDNVETLYETIKYNRSI
jgi:hypothetical protein